MEDSIIVLIWSCVLSFKNFREIYFLQFVLNRYCQSLTLSAMSCKSCCILNRPEENFSNYSNCEQLRKILSFRIPAERAFSIRFSFRVLQNPDQSLQRHGTSSLPFFQIQSCRFPINDANLSFTFTCFSCTSCSVESRTCLPVLEERHCLGYRVIWPFCEMVQP